MKPCRVMFAFLLAVASVGAYAGSSVDLAELFTNEPEGLPPSLDYSPNEYDWQALRQHSLSEGTTYGDRDNQPPYVMLAGYYDTDVTYEDGGTVTLIAYVMDPDGYSDIARVELFYAGVGTDVLLLDDGTSGDFGPGDEIFGFTVDLAPGDLPPGDYILEIQAQDHQGNTSDLWPYLTIHP